LTNIQTDIQVHWWQHFAPLPGERKSGQKRRSDWG